jgi:hypothetical protein
MLMTTATGCQGPQKQSKAPWGLKSPGLVPKATAEGTDSTRVWGFRQNQRLQGGTHIKNPEPALLLFT